MDRRKRAFLRTALLGVALVLAVSLTQAAAASASVPSGQCTLTSLPSFVAEGEFGEASSVADILEMQCEKVYAGGHVRFTANQLYNRCQKKLTWSTPTPFAPVAGSSYSAKLDGNGRALVVLWGGPSCAAGESLMSAHMEGPPYTTVTTQFKIIAPMPTETGIFALTPNLKSSEVENSETSSVAVIVAVEFPPLYAEAPVRVSAEQLFTQCKGTPKLRWVGAGAKEKAAGVNAVSGLTLDNDGNAFVVILGGPSCAPSTGEITANLEVPPSTHLATSFTVLPPQ